MLTQQELQKLLEQLKRHEGTKRDAQGLHIAYRCTAGALTIGYGHNLDANPIPGITATSKLDEQQATDLLNSDVQQVERQLQSRLPFVQRLDSVRYATLVNMAFNLGLGGLLTFNNTLANIEAGLYEIAASRMLQSKWARQVGYRARELAQQMRTGEWA